MFNMLKELYNEGRIGDVELERAVTYKWITEEEKKLIIESKTSTIV